MNEGCRFALIDDDRVMLNDARRGEESGSEQTRALPRVVSELRVLESSEEPCRVLTRPQPAPCNCDASNRRFSTLLRPWRVFLRRVQLTGFFGDTLSCPGVSRSSVP
jgi:hypothetical protein